MAFDTNAKQGIDTRVKALDMLASQRMPAIIYHLPWPGIGYPAILGGTRIDADRIATSPSLAPELP